MNLQETVKKHVSYNPETGEVTRIYSASPRLRGKVPFVITSPVNGNGYIEVAIEGKSYTLHQIAWIIKTGGLPDADKRIDHRDRNKLNNAWSNLRELSAGGNVRNQSQTSSKSASGFTGVSLVKEKVAKGHKKPWMAHIRIDKKLRLIGYFATVEEAVAARAAAHEEQSAIDDRNT